MADLLGTEIAAPFAALSAEPLSIAELDTHQDGARIWATILRMRQEHYGVLDEAEEAAESELETGLKQRDEELANREGEIADLADKILDLEAQIVELETELTDYMLAA